MQKVYLLLRNNQQTGPFNLEELIRFDLKPYDLIWMEGKSAGWYYPQEIKALQSHLSFLKQTPAQQVVNTTHTSTDKISPAAQPKKVFVSMPSVTREESTPKPSLATVSTFQAERPKLSEPVQSQKEAEEIKPSYSPSTKEIEIDYMTGTHQKKPTKKPVVSVKGAIAACLVVGLAAAAWWVMKPQEEVSKNVSTEPTSFVPAQNELLVDSTSENENPSQNNKTVASKKGKKNKTPTIDKNPTTIIKTLDLKKPVEEVTSNTSSTESKIYESAPPVAKEETKPVVEEKNETVPAEVPKEKKKLRDKFFDLFKKKSQEKTEDAKPVEEEDGKRNSTRRETDANLTQMVTVKFAIPNDWMMGIKGAKATLTNRSSEAIVKAVVEVVYYNDDNDVMDKKTIFFTDIKSKQTKTVAVPDHSTATRLEYNVISATGAGEPFAKR